MGKNNLPNILLVSDFFLPNLGGVEIHVFELGNALVGLGYKTVVATVQRGNRCGIRFFGSRGLKVYYLPYPTPLECVCFPGIGCFTALLRDVIIREEIDILHGHQATATLALEAVIVARQLGCRTIYTDHSAFGLAEFGGLHINKLLELCCGLCHRMISVSHTLRENLVLRGKLDPSKIFVIPNAFDASCFIPEIDNRPKAPKVRIIVISRLTYRKGLELLVTIIPKICQLCPTAEFIIGGDGPQRALLEDMRDTNQLQNRVFLKGYILPENVPKILNQGNIFLNCSLTESFCIAIIEAAACGLRIVATNVGGVPEVLPKHLINLCPPKPQALIDAVIKEVNRPVDSLETMLKHYHEIKSMYNWNQTALRVAKVYSVVMQESPYLIADELKHLWSNSFISGKIWLIYVMLIYFILKILDKIYPIPRETNPALQYSYSEKSETII